METIFYTSNDFEEGRSGHWASEVAQLDSVKSLKAKAYAQKAQYQAKVKDLARVREEIEELAKLKAEEEV
jgi:chaperonin cofactor prefoldin